MKRHILVLIGAMITMVSCENYLEKFPVDAIGDDVAITDLESAQGAMDGLYNVFPGAYTNGTYIISSLGRMSDNQNGIEVDQFTSNSVDPQVSGTLWNSSFLAINRANHIIEKVPGVQDISNEQKNRLVAEAKFIRAFEHLQGVLFYGDFPWSSTTDFRIVQDLPRLPKENVYSNIIGDLLEAEQDLPTSYVEAGNSRARSINSAATAIVARVYLYTQNWDEAERKATEVIDNQLYSLASDYNNVFLANSSESILEYLYQNEAGNSLAVVYLTEEFGGIYSNVPTEKILTSFETGDIRRDAFLGLDSQGFPYISKYRELGANQEVKVIRLAELYLIRSEARAQQGNLTGAVEDLNIIRSRAGLPPVAVSTQSEILLTIENERFVELCFEGHRWIDLVRTDRANAVLGSFNPMGWDETDILLPVPQGEIDLNPNLLPQNPGY